MSDKLKEYWIGKGKVTCPDAHAGGKVGDDEWQFSDGPLGQRGSSADFLTLEAGIAYLSPAIFHIDEDYKPEADTLPEMDEAETLELILSILNKELTEGDGYTPRDDRALAEYIHAIKQPKPAIGTDNFLCLTMASVRAAEEALELVLDTHVIGSQRHLVQCVINALAALNNDTDCIVLLEDVQAQRIGR